MPQTIILSSLPADATQRDLLEKLFTSPGFTLLKEIVAAHCTKAQTEHLNRVMYPKNEVNREIGSDKLEEAVLLNAMLDKLDEIEKKEQNWFTVTLEHSR